MHIQKTDKGYFIRLETEEEVMGGLKKLITEERISSAAFTAIGAASEIELGFYDLGKKEYQWKTFSGTYEIIGVMGNVSWMNWEPITHMHGVFSGKDYVAFGGHIRKMIVGASCEIMLVPHDIQLERGFDETTGLNLWKF